MKIFFVYKDYFGRRARYGKMMELLGHKVEYFRITKKAPRLLQPKHIKKSKPDLVWFLNPFYVRNNVEAVNYIRAKKIPTVMYGTFNPQEPYTDWLSTWQKIDYLFVHHTGFCNWLKSQGLNAYFMPVGFYPDMYYKHVKPKSITVSFCGGVKTFVDPQKDKRCVYLQSLKDMGVVVYGERFKAKLKGIPVHSYDQHQEQMDVYARTTINLDLPYCSGDHSFYQQGPHLKNRFFEIPATDNFLLTLRSQESLDILDETMVGYFDDNVDSLREMVGKYLKDEKIRKEMTARAYHEVHEKHTFKKRFKQIFKILRDI